MVRQYRHSGTRFKDIGTKAESAVVTYQVMTYWPYAERRSLQGVLDKGDTTGHPGLCFEVKAGVTPKFPQWLRETEIERINAKAQFGILVHKPLGVGFKNVPKWTALMEEQAFISLLKQACIASAFTHVVPSVRLDLRKEMKDHFGDPEHAGFIEVIKVKANKNIPDYVATYLSTMVDILHQAGYGQK